MVTLCLCYVTAAAGAITLSALEGRSGRDSPQTLVTCIVRADWGGWLSSKSTMFALCQVRPAVQCASTWLLHAPSAAEHCMVWCC